MSEVEWPEPKFPEVECKKSLEIKGTKSNLFGQVVARPRETKEQTWRLNAARFSSWKRLIRVQSWVKRFANNSRTKKEVRFCGCLTPEEIEETEMDAIRVP